MSEAVCLVSGGVDSCVAAAEAAAAGYTLHFLHASYGQRTEQRELEAFRQLCRHFRVASALEIDLRWLGRVGGSALTDRALSLPEGQLERSEIPASYVPFRNGNLLAAGTSWAESLGAERLYIGAVEEDSSGYPDCRKEYFEVFQEVVNRGTRPSTGVQIVTPLIDLKKSEIVARGARLNAPFDLTWSCYRSETEACGTCDSCLLRLRAFEKAGQPDPIPYRGSAESKA